MVRNEGAVLVCPACRTKNREEARFCKSCGAELVPACPACGTAHEPDQSFCDSCGAELDGATGDTASLATTPPPAPAGTEGPSSELRHVSVLFVDLVGFTSISE